MVKYFPLIVFTINPYYYNYLDLVPWKTIQIFVALGMGFRPDSESQTVCQVDVYTPPTWKKMGVLPNIQIDQDILLKMEHELPNSEDAEDDPMGKGAISQSLSCSL
jgi:hypothetical protein